MRVCVFCGSSPGGRPEYAEAARRLGQELAHRGHELVYGGAKVGTMGVLADSVLEGGGRALGIMPQVLVEKGVAHEGLTEFRVVGSMSERKTMMIEISDAFVALPGGFGTLEELSEVLTGAQLGWHRKPCGAVDVLGYYTNFIGFLETMVTARFLKNAHKELLLVASDPVVLLEQLEDAEVPLIDKWLGREKN